MKKKEISVEKVVKMGEALTYIEDMVKCLKDGKLVIGRKDDFASLTPPSVGTVKMEVEAKKKKNKEQIEISLSWQHVDEDEISDDLTISSTEPEIVESPEVDDEEEETLS